MKKECFFIVCFLLLTLEVFSQSGLTVQKIRWHIGGSFGVTAAVIDDNFYEKSERTYKYYPYGMSRIVSLGFSVGAELVFSDKWSVQTGLGYNFAKTRLYTSYGSDLINMGIPIEFLSAEEFKELHYLHIPLLAKYRFSQRDALGAGLCVNFLTREDRMHDLGNIEKEGLTDEQAEAVFDTWFDKLPETTMFPIGFMLEYQRTIPLQGPVSINVGPVFNLQFIDAPLALSTSRYTHLLSGRVRVGVVF